MTKRLGCSEPATPDDVSKHEAVLLMVQGIIEQLHRSPGLGNGPFSLDGWKIIRDALETPRSEIAPITKHAQIGGTIFHPGIAVQTVIDRAYREYEYQQTPEREVARLALAKESIGRMSGAAENVLKCPKCGVDRFQAPCPEYSYPHNCPMVGTTEGPK